MSERATNAKFQLLYERVFDEIRSGQFRPGDRIGIKDLAFELKVSPTPLREVLSRLVGRGLIEERRSEGYYLARLDAQDIADFLRLHERCLLLAAKQVSGYLADFSEVLDPWSFFAGLANATGNNAIIEMRALLADRLAIIRRLEDATVVTKEVEGLKQSTGPIELPALKVFIRQFHASRIGLAPALALQLARAPRG